MKQGAGNYSRDEVTAAAEAFKEILAKDPNETGRLMTLLKGIRARNAPDADANAQGQAPAPTEGYPKEQGEPWDTKNYSPTFGDQDSKLKQFVKNVNPFTSELVTINALTA